MNQVSSAARFGQIKVELKPVKMGTDQLYFALKLTGKHKREFKDVLTFNNKPEAIQAGSIPIWTSFPDHSRREGFRFNQNRAVLGFLNIPSPIQAQLLRLIDRAPLDQATQGFLKDSLNAHCKPVEVSPIVQP